METGTNEIGQAHSDDCETNFGAMSFDQSCPRCKKINIVMMLKRKNTNNGCSIEEALTASLMVNRLVTQYRLTKGEIFDREYDQPIVIIRQAAQQTYHKTYGAAKARHVYRRRPVKIHTWAEREAYDEDITDD